MKGKAFALIAALLFGGLCALPVPSQQTAASPSGRDHASEIRELRNELQIAIERLHTATALPSPEMLSLQAEVQELRAERVAREAAAPPVDHTKELTELKFAMAQLETERDTATELIKQLEDRLKPAAPVPAPPKPRQQALPVAVWQTSAGNCSNGSCGRARIFGRRG